MQISYDHYLIIDLEATCSDKNELPRHEMEIIEIGAVMLSKQSFEIESEFQTQFTQDCTYHGVDYPFKSGHMNLKAEFSRALGLKKKLGIIPALRHLGLDFDGSPHRGIDDAKNIARIVRRVMMRP